MTILDIKNPQEFKPSFLLPEENSNIVIRKHWFVLTYPFALLLFSFFFFVLALVFFSLFLKVSLGLFVLSLFFIVLIALGLSIKIIVDYLFNFYMITIDKISEIRINPLFGESIEEILLKQVRCTEVDIQNFGIINQLLNKGDILITFDRPTHKEEFVLENIANPRIVATSLSKILIYATTDTNAFWTKNKFRNEYRYADEIKNYPGIGGDY